MRRPIQTGGGALPDDWYKRPPRRPQTVRDLGKKVYKTEIGFNKAVRRTAWRQILREVAEGIIVETKAAHIKMTLDGAQKYGFFQETDPIAIVVDGDPRKSVTKVNVFGEIVFARRDKRAMIEAAGLAYVELIRETQRFKTRTGLYAKGIEIWVNGSFQVSPRNLLDLDPAKVDEIMIVGAVKYARKIEALYEPFRTVWKRLRASGWMRRVAIQQEYLDGPHRADGGWTIIHPVLRFQPVGEKFSKMAREPGRRRKGRRRR